MKCIQRALFIPAACALTLFLYIPCQGGAHGDEKPLDNKTRTQKHDSGISPEDKKIIKNLELLKNLDLLKNNDVEMLKNLELFLANS